VVSHRHREFVNLKNPVAMRVTTPTGRLRYSKRVRGAVMQGRQIVQKQTREYLHSMCYGPRRLIR
jgi:hypothetical protein